MAQENDKKSVLPVMTPTDHEEETEALDEEISDLLELPKKERRLVQSVMASFQMIQKSGTDSAVASKITDEHITQYLAGSRENMQREYKDKHEVRLFQLAVLVIICLVMIGIILLLKDNPDVMEKIIYTVGGVVVGALGGYGYGKSKKSSE